MKIEVSAKPGLFAENKEQARRLRARLLRELRSSNDSTVQLDFGNVEYATQSYVHALIAEAIRDESIDALDRIEFLNCNDEVKAIIEVVVSYSQDDWSADEDPEDDPSDAPSAAAV